jgi:hypothetical protein
VIDRPVADALALLCIVAENLEVLLHVLHAMLIWRKARRSARLIVNIDLRYNAAKLG